MTSTSTLPTAQPLQIGAAQIHLQNVQLREDVTLDEVHLEGETLRLEMPAAGEPAHVTTGETRFRVVMSEANLNRTLAANLPPEAEIRNVRLVTLSGKVRFTGQRVVLGLGVPFTVEAVPRIENGVRAFPDLQALNAAGMPMPAAFVEILEQRLRKTLTLDLTQVPIPVWLDEIRCEPGRLTVLGKARFVWPPTPLAPPVPPFSARESSAVLESVEAQTAIPEPPPAPSLPE
jgi:hypothetical protein